MQFIAGGGVGQAVTRPWGGSNATLLTPPSSFMGVDVRYRRPVSSLQASAWACGDSYFLACYGSSGFLRHKELRRLGALYLVGCV